jgi:hypothetical protein
MKTQLFKIAVLLLLVFTVASCTKKNSVSPNSKKLSYQFKVANTSVPLSASVHNSTLTTMATSGGNITWQSGYINVLSITFEGKNENDNNLEEDFKEPAVYKVDLFNNNQLLGNVDIPIGTYHNTDIKVDIKQSSTGSALYLKGSYATAKGSTPVELSFDEENDQMEILVNAKDLTVGAKDTYIASINVHLDKLMAGVTAADLDGATLSNGAILINSNNNISIYNKIKANLNGCSDEDSNN